MTDNNFRGDKIVSFHPVRSRAVYPALRQVEAYWEAVREGRLMPARSEIDPRGMASSLEFAFILEKIAPGLARIRLGGMHLNELMAMEVRGMPVTAMFLPEARREMQKVLESVLDTPAAVRLTLAGERGLRRGHLEGDMLLLPLRDDMGAPTRILGALQTHGPIGRGPRRFAIRDIETKPLLGDPLATARHPNAAAIWDVARTTAPEPGKSPPPATARRIAALNRKTDAPDAAHPHLRLVHDADELV